MFYPVKNSDLKIGKNDILASRCTMNSASRNETTEIGARNQDEMCNFYLMFSTRYRGKLENLACFNDAQVFSWSKNLINASSIKLK